MKTSTTQLVPYSPTVDLQQFRLVTEPTLEALTNDGQKFVDIVRKGTNYQLLGTFLLGVTLHKAKAMIGNGSRGTHAKGESGWMDYKKKAYPDTNNRYLTDAFNFTKTVFESWENGKFDTVSNLRIGAITEFQLPENAEELNVVLTGIHDAMDGKTVTAICRGLGCIRDAEKQGTYDRKPRDLRKAIDEAAEVDEDACKSLISDMLMLADGRNPNLGEQKISMLHKLEQTSEVFLASVRTIIKARKAAKA